MGSLTKDMLLSKMSKKIELKHQSKNADKLRNSLSHNVRNSLGESSSESSEQAEGGFSINCKNHKRGCSMSLPKCYISFHEKFLCPYRKWENNKCTGYIQSKIINEKRPLVKIGEDWFLIKKQSTNVKIILRSKTNDHYKITFFDKKNEERKTKLRFSQEKSINIIPSRYFEEVDFLKFKIIRNN